MADALASGNIDAGVAGASADPACWMPLMTTAAGDPRRFRRLLEAAARPAEVLDHGWASVLYPLFVLTIALGMLITASWTLLPAFEDLFNDYGSELPPITRQAMALATFMRSGWQPLLLAGFLLLAGRWLFRFWSRRSAAVAETFTRFLARLTERGIPQDEAMVLAARGVGVTPCSSRWPRRPMSHAAVAALAHATTVSVTLLDAIADCHAERAMRSRGTAGMFAGPVAVIVVGGITYFLFRAMLAPMIKLIGDLS
jgi:hypothetical protein